MSTTHTSLITDRRSGIIPPLIYRQPSTLISRAVTAAAANSRHQSARRGGRNSKRYSVSTFYSMAAEQDVEVQDELAEAQLALRELKSKISSQSKQNFVLERDVRFLDSRIALLINRALDVQNEMASHLEEEDDTFGYFLDDRKMQQYGNLFFLLQSEPRHAATLCRLVSLGEIDTLLQTVMFTLYGNQYESREEHLLLSMFQNVLVAQFETTTEFASLLRANTPVSRMMTTYTRRGPGQSYLKHTLSERINGLLERKELNLQINPLKVQEEILAELEQEYGGELPPGIVKSTSAEEAARDPQVRAAIEPRIVKLIAIANSFLDTIIGSLDHVPYGIRWICKQIKLLTKRKYPDASESAISSLIGGFFFLRYLNPAIVTPQAYMLVEGKPATYPRITLTMASILPMIAKLLQNLANKPSYAKESYMIPTNVFVESNKQRINKFLNDLCEVGDFYESLEMDQYMALSKKDIIISITPNEIFNTHALIQRHINVLAPKEDDHLRILLAEVGPAPQQVPRKQNKALDLQLFSRWEMPIQDLTTTLMSENSITHNDILYMETKAIFVQLLRSLPYLSRPPLRLARIAETAGTANDAQLVRKGIKVKEMLLELEQLGVIDKSDGYSVLAEEIEQELAHLGDLKLRVMEETRSLESVYKTIQDHNNYLHSQLETYKAYLQNVRIQSGGGTGKKQVGIGVQINEVNKGKQKPTKPQTQGPVKFSHQQLERDGIIVETEVPEYRRSSTFLMISSPVPGTYIISLHHKGRSNAIMEIDLKLDDLLEKQQDQIQSLDLKYIKVDVSRTLQLLTKTFLSRNK
ncbi:Rho GTPase activation protein [Dichotomocladium elegans]|nr:Rho GTPase activation protein [Dichotomocladium elegans]